MERQTIGKFIAALRKVNGMTQAGLAERLGVTNKSVSKWERDECYPDLTLIPVLAEIFNVTSDEILKGARIINNGNEAEPKPQKTEKQASRLIQKTVTDFKHLSLIPIFITITGLIFLVLPVMIQTAGIIFFVVCIVIFVLFTALSIILEIVFSSRAKAALFNLNDEEKFYKQLLKAASAIENYIFNIIFINVVVLLGIAFLYVMGFKIYFFPFLALAAYICAYIVKILLTDKKYYDVSENIQVKKKLKKLNIYNFIAAAGLTIVSLVLTIFAFVFPPYVGGYEEVKQEFEDATVVIQYKATDIVAKGVNNEFLFGALFMIFFVIVGIGITYAIIRKKILKPYSRLK